jgi:hypothetical protein
MDVQTLAQSIANVINQAALISAEHRITSCPCHQSTAAIARPILSKKLMAFQNSKALA